MNLPRVILASASPRRAQLLRQFEIDFAVMSSDAAETRAEHLSPVEACLLNAYRKSRVVAKKVPDALVIGADTEVCLGPRIFGKPKDAADAARMLSELEGREHQVVTGVCLVCLRQHRQKLFAVQTRVRFKSLGADEIGAYLEKIDPLDKAGAYALQEHGEMIVDTVSGSRSNVVGLPIERLQEELEQWYPQA